MPEYPGAMEDERRQSVADVEMSLHAQVGRSGYRPLRAPVPSWGIHQYGEHPAFVKALGTDYQARDLGRVDRRATERELRVVREKLAANEMKGSSGCTNRGSSSA